MDLGRSETFILVDTEAVDPETRAQLRLWASKQSLFPIVSMDCNGDRPLLMDASGEVVPGDVLGQITGAFLGAERVVTPVSSNTGTEQVFPQIIRTQIGSPFVIAGMKEAGGDVVGYEASGGFLLGFAAEGLAPLMTRDAVLPIIALLMASKGQSVAAMVADQPARFTAADRFQEVPTEASAALIKCFACETSTLDAFLAQVGGEAASIDQTDGLRVTLTDGRIVHLRPPGNAPECRIYADAGTREVAEETLQQGLVALRTAIS